MLFNGADRVKARSKEIKSRWTRKTNLADQRKWKPKPEVGD